MLPSGDSLKRVAAFAGRALLGAVTVLIVTFIVCALTRCDYLDPFESLTTDRYRATRDARFYAKLLLAVMILTGALLAGFAGRWRIVGPARLLIGGMVIGLLVCVLLGATVFPAIMLDIELSNATEPIPNYFHGKITSGYQAVGVIYGAMLGPVIGLFGGLATWTVMTAMRRWQKAHKEFDSPVLPAYNDEHSPSLPP